MRHFNIPFTEVVVQMAQETTRAEILRYSPSAKCPCLQDGAIAVWDSLAIIEYLAETFPDLAIWPRDRAARAEARSLAAEMHSSFMAMRSNLPMNMWREPKAITLTPEALADIARPPSRPTHDAPGRNTTCPGAMALCMGYHLLIRRARSCDSDFSIKLQG